MSDAAIIRLFGFRAARRGFDEILRTSLVPDLRALPGVLATFSGRQGPDETGPRLLASVWADREAMVEAVGEELGQFHPEYLDLTTDRTLVAMPIRVVRTSDVAAEPRLLRVLRGSTRPGELDAYVREVAQGVDRDVADGHGPAAIYLGQAGDDEFVTVSAWATWEDVAHATGGDIHRPLVTRHPERLTTWDVDYYEIVPD